MKYLGTLIKDFVKYYEYAHFVGFDRGSIDNLPYPISMKISRFRIPPHNTLAIKVVFEWSRDGLNVVDVYVIYSDDLTRKVYWKEYANSNIVGPFETYEIAAMSLECYLMSLYNDVIWGDSSEIILDFKMGWD